MGEYELYLLIGDNTSEKKVLEMRQAGMKIVRMLDLEFQ